MALINCPECRSEVSDQAFKCQKCGFQLRKVTRSFFGKIIKWSFIGWNVLMAISLWSGMSAAVSMSAGLTSTAEQAGAAVGTGVGAAIIIGVWAFGSLILGLFVFLTRPKRD